MYPIFKIKKIHLKSTQGDLLTNHLLNSMKFCIGKKKIFWVVPKKQNNASHCSSTSSHTFECFDADKH